jgi:hypothetical protein
MMILCQHFIESGRKDGGTCLAGLHGGRPSYGTCRACPHKEKGLGDLVALIAEPIAKAIGYKCGKPCNKRRETLNRLTPQKRQGGHA